jgi:hypothetical protein
MKVRVQWINGSETDLEMESLRQLDRFLGDHTSDAVFADLKPFPDGLKLVFVEAAPRTVEVAMRPA